jgi:D-glycero-D-manno-heptose 1,7-bisphosphate phosphatase
MVTDGAARAVFLDRDGVLTVPEFRNGRSFAPRRLTDFRLYDDARMSLGRLKTAGFKLIVVTNQPDVGNGIVERSVIDEMHRRLAAELPIDAVEVCYHRQQDGCDCRKPKPGMLERAAARFGIDCRMSVMIGDRGTDVAAGQALGCATILINRGYRGEDPGAPDHTVLSLAEAAEIVLAEGIANRN